MEFWVRIFTSAIIRKSQWKVRRRASPAFPPMPHFDQQRPRHMGRPWNWNCTNIFTCYFLRHYAIRPDGKYIFFKICQDDRNFPKMHFLSVNIFKFFPNKDKPSLPLWDLYFWHHILMSKMYEYETNGQCLVRGRIICQKTYKNTCLQGPFGRKARGEYKQIWRQKINGK